MTNDPVNNEDYLYYHYTEEELEAYREWQNSHQCVIQETPDGMGCVTCLYH
jgi:hypothetical protein